MRSTIKAFNLPSGYAPSYKESFYDSNVPYLHRSVGDGSLNTPAVLSAQLTQEVNKGGVLNLSLRKPVKNLNDDYAIRDVVNYYDWFIEVSTPYNMEGVQSYVAEHSDLLTKWWGQRVSTIERPDRYDLVYEGQLSWLSYIVVEPYATTAQNLSGYTGIMLGKYNNALASSFYLDILWNGNNAYTGTTTVRGNSSLSNVYDEINEKVLKKYDNQLAVYTSNTNANRRVILLRQFPSTPSGVINGQDIMSVSHTVSGADRHRTWYLYGAKTDESTEGDLTRIKGEYTIYQSGYNQTVNKISQTFGVYDDITTTETLDTKAQESYNQSLLDSDGIELTITPEKASELLLGDLYTVSCPKAGISGEYRLTKRVIDVLNPARNRYTFGTAQRLISRR